ncbi:oligopeptidase A [Zooshikella harenae]|uniref:oligopeptidase A n=1 Tax=Zooshikella harenae TaxID=2827238 RepID=A0ABS5ZHP2_9GAMM|nr:oligopeptidase A [Zooshikella harenae]MBU2713586.1 oligopeptidase A [Zooshikella harenae]
MTSQPNPLLTDHELPPFSLIKPEHVEPAISQLIEESKAHIEKTLEEVTHFTWENLVEPLEVMGNKLSKAWSPVSHLNSVLNSDELRQAYNACLPKLSEYGTWLGQHKKLYKAYKDIADSPEYSALDKAQKKVIDNALRDFHLSGVDLEGEKKQRYGEIRQRMSELTSKYSENVLDATQAWSKLLKDKEALAGLPESALEQAAALAEAKGESGYLLTLDFPSYLPVMTYAQDRALRQEMYTAYNTRASDQGPNAGEFDNGPLMDEILALRQELAELLSFKNYAEYSLATKMAESTEQVTSFLHDLAKRSKPQAQREFSELQHFASSLDKIEHLEAWDVAYYAEQLKHQRYEINQELLRPYFPVEKVINGMFNVVQQLFNISIEQVTDVDTWHPDVRFYQIKHEKKLIGQFYLDLFARPNKRGGAWMDECRVRFKQAKHLQLPVAYLVCNFTPPVGDKPSLLTHDEVTTLFHEFGHGLHHMLTKIDYSDVSGINGVAWDAVELPSQFLENWCWEPEALQIISGHYQTGETLPQDMLERMLAAKNFQSAMFMVRQLEFSLFDFLLHKDYVPEINIQQVLDQVREEVAVVPAPIFNRFQHGFSHIFAGGYAAGYYSYKWAEVLSADAFSRFEEEGIFNTETGQSFLESILERGGSEEPMDLFKRFRGREPDITPLLRHSGIIADVA